MILAHHLIWTAYGWWLPNDPRGSHSIDFRVEHIKELGEIHHGRKETQPHWRVVQEHHDKAADTLKHPLLAFDEDERNFVGKCIGDVIRDRGYTCYACAIMPEHIHLLIRKHRDRAETMIEALQTECRLKLIEDERRSPTHPVWGGKGWKVFVDSVERMLRVTEYIRMNPIKAGLPEQRWNFVTPYQPPKRK